MRTCDRLRSTEVWAGLQLLVDLLSPASQPRSVHSMAAERLCELLGAQACMIGEVPRRLDGVKSVWTHYADHGWRNLGQRHAIFSSHDDPMAADPCLTALLDHIGDCVTRGRHELTPDDQWESCRYFAQYRKPAGLGEQALSMWTNIPRRGWAGLIAVHRAHGQPAFDEASLCLLDLLHRQLAGLLWKAQSIHLTPPLVRPAAQVGGVARAKRGLTPAQLRVLPYVLEGHREEKIAELLCRSRHTIHDHVMAIYKEFGVHNRVELLLKLGGPTGGEAAADGGLAPSPGTPDGRWH